MSTSSKEGLCADLALLNGRVLTVVRDRLKRRIRLPCFGAEEIGLYGSARARGLQEHRLAYRCH